MKSFLSPKTEPPRSSLADLELMMWSKENPCAYERGQTKLPPRFCVLLVGFRGPWAGHFEQGGALMPPALYRKNELPSPAKSRRIPGKNRRNI
jgi:hypothetical protein